MRADRLLSLLLLLQARGRQPAPALAAELEVSVRTVYRDVEALSVAGVPVYAEPGRNGGISLLPGYRADVTGLTPGEAQALFTYAGQARHADQATDERLRSAFRKLLVALPEAHRPAAAAAGERIIVEAQGWGHRPEPLAHLPALQEAVLAGHRIDLDYRTPGKAAKVSTVDAVGLVAKAGVWYLIARREGEPRLYRVSRVRGLTVVGLARVPDGSPTVAELWDGLRSRVERLGDGIDVVVRVQTASLTRVLGMVASQVSAPPERTPEHETEDGAEVWRLRFRAIEHARGVLLGFGTDVHVLDPPAVQAELVRAAAAVVAAY